MTTPTPLSSALAKLDGCTAKQVYLSPGECNAIIRYIAAHGISGRFARQAEAEHGVKRGRKGKVKE